MKKIYSLFAAVIIAASVNAQTTTFDFGAQGYSNAQVITSGTVNSSVSFTVSQNSGSNPPTYYTSGGALRFYADSATGDGGGMTFTSASGKRITTLVINAVSATYTPAISYTVDGGTPVVVNAVGTTYTISGISASSTLTFKNAVVGASTQLRITTFTITSDATLAVGDVNAVSTNFVKNTIVENNIIFAAKANVQVINMNGQVVKTASVNENSSLEVSTLPKGTYIVTGSVNGKAVSQKIIKK